MGRDVIECTSSTFDSSVYYSIGVLAVEAINVLIIVSSDAEVCVRLVEMRVSAVEWPGAFALCTSFLSAEFGIAAGSICFGSSFI